MPPAGKGFQSRKVTSGSNGGFQSQDMPFLEDWIVVTGASEADKFWIDKPCVGSGGAGGSGMSCHLWRSFDILVPGVQYSNPVSQ